MDIDTNTPVYPTPSKRPLFFGSDDEPSDTEDAPPTVADASTSTPAPAPKRRPSPVSAPSNTHTSYCPPLKKPKIEASTSSPPRTSPTPAEGTGAPTFEHRYIGDLVLAGWSTVKGSGYVKDGERIVIERKKPVEEKVKMKTVRKEVKVKATGKGKNKQQATTKTVTTTVPVAPKKKGEDTVIRFLNTRGFEVGRLPTSHASYLSKLLDHDIIHLAGHVVAVSLPLRSGDDIYLSLRVSLRSSAFLASPAAGKKKAQTGFAPDAGKETAQEKVLGERKAALLRLFKDVGIKPVRSSAVVQMHKDKGALEKGGADLQLDHYADAAKALGKSCTSASASSSRKPSASRSRGSSAGPIELGSSDDEASPSAAAARPKGKGKAAAVKVEDGEEEEGQELSDDQLQLVYRKAQANDRALGELEPPDSFRLKLRRYQKQALKWMAAMELGETDARDQSMHPLWEAYEFPLLPDAAELDADYRTFYFNPYSGELSLDFPKASKKCRGGIQGDEMGMGKTIMMAALIHTNRVASSAADEPSSSSPDPDASSDVEILPTLPGKKRVKAAPLSDSDDDWTPARSKPRQLKLDAAFRPVASSRPLARPAKKLLPPTRRLDSATLVIAPMSLLGQWRDELLRSGRKGSLNVLVYYGAERVDLDAALGGAEEDAEEDAEERAVDVVITSYGTLLSEYGRWERAVAGGKEDGPTLFDFYWHRCVLDEAHHIKTRTTQNAKACYAIKAHRRWALTGTPIVNRLEDLYSLSELAVHFLRIEPWGNFSFFRSFITIPFQNKDPKAVDIVQVVLESCLIRREKKMKDADGKSIVELPPKHLHVEHLEFAPEERQIYKAIFNKAKRKFDALAAAGLALKNFTNIFAMLLRLRQAVLHPFLVTTKKKALNTRSATADGGDPEADFVLDEDDDPAGVDVQKLIARFATGEEVGDADAVFATQVLQKIVNGDEDDEECPICMETPMENPVLLPCMHHTCKGCVLEYFDRQEGKGEEPSCPVCRKGPVQGDQLLEIVHKKKPAQTQSADDGNVDMPDVPSSSPAVRLRKNKNFRSSTKLDALAVHLSRLRDEDPEFKAVVFSQFTSFLDLIEKTLYRERIAFVRLDGSVSQKQREAVLKEFENATEGCVMLISLRAGGVGLNLTSANHVFMMDCWWNEAVESQAIDRIHRIGQQREVHVTRFIINETIEDRILQIQKRKTALVMGALGGTSREEDRQQTLENLQLMFSK